MDLLCTGTQPMVLTHETNQAKIAVAESFQVCYTHLTRGVRSRNRLLCAFEGAIVVDTSAITTYTASLICARCFALKQTDLQHLEDDMGNMSCVGTS
jgi:hypothetical protein